MRTIVEDGDAALELDRAEVRWERAHYAWECITWIVLHDPFVGTAMTESGLTRAYTFDGALSLDMPTATIVYVIEEQRIIVIDARFEDSKYGQAGRA